MSARGCRGRCSGTMSGVVVLVVRDGGGDPASTARWLSETSSDARIHDRCVPVAVFPNADQSEECFVPYVFPTRLSSRIGLIPQLAQQAPATTHLLLNGPQTVSKQYQKICTPRNVHTRPLPQLKHPLIVPSPDVPRQLPVSQLELRLKRIKVRLF